MKKAALLKIAPSPVNKENRPKKQRTIQELFARSKSESNLTKKTKQVQKVTAAADVSEVVLLDDDSDDSQLVQQLDLLDKKSDRAKSTLTDIQNKVCLRPFLKLLRMNPFLQWSYFL